MTVFLGGELGGGLLAGLGGGLAELFALHHRCLLQRGVHGGVSVGRRWLARHLGEGRGDRLVHRLVDPGGIVGLGRLVPAPGDPTAASAAAAPTTVTSNSTTIMSMPP